ncbi:unnamed protein product [Trichogramma brassicae]|uniref:Uncharacterized protein n=1 Tax=Trichogramma brassicae TaxID=86971 RepID=A0A6H5IGU8_9HYME|nr:unnamed protein product [Trichogramma brassicae]
MIATARKCGCPDLDKPSPCGDSIFSGDSDCQDLPNEKDDCGCDGDDGCSADQPESKVVSEIADKGLPYKEIETLFNNNRMVIRIQSLKPPKEFDPPCDCSENEENVSKADSLVRFFCHFSCSSSVTRFFRYSIRYFFFIVNMCALCAVQSGRRSDVIFQKAEGCRTINVYPQPGPKKERIDTSKKSAAKSPIELPSVNPEENPNIFVLKIKRKVDNGEKKQNLDLEYRSPRPWRKKDYFK